MINKVQPKQFNYRTNQTKKIQYTKNQIDQTQKPNNNNSNMVNKNIPTNMAYNNRAIQNNLNQNRNMNMNYMSSNNNNNSNNISSTSNNTHNISNSNQNDELGKAILIIRRECKRKDDRIRDLEKKVMELTNKLNILLKNNKNSIELNDDYNNNIIEYRPFTGSPAKKMNFGENIDEAPLGRDIRGYSIGYTGINHKNNPRSNSFMQSNSQNKLNYNSDTEKMVNKRLPGYDNLSHSNDHSVLTYNGGGSQTSTKADVKNYLKEVKSKIEPKKFKEFIRNIKLLTAKNNNSLNKDIIVESVRILFGDEHKDLFIKFQSIIGFKK